MKQKLNTLVSSTFFKVSVFTSLSTGIKLITSFVSAKVIALYIGPAGLGMLGQLSSFIAIALTFSTGAIQNGVVKYLAEYQENEIKQNQVLHAAIRITTIGALLSGVVAIVFAGWWSFWLFGHTDYAYIIWILGATLICHSIYSLFSSVLNGLREFKKYNQLAIVASITGLVTTYILVRLYGVEGGLLSLALYQVVVCMAILFFYNRIRKIRWRSVLASKPDSTTYKALLAFSMMAIVTSVVTPAVQILIRKHLLIQTSAVEMGFYEGIVRISQLYLLLITTTLSVYYLPKLSSIHDEGKLRYEINKAYAFLLPATAFILIVVYFFREWIIALAFSDSFAGMEHYFLPQLLGDFFKIASWLLAFLMIAKAKTMWYIITEIIFGALLLAAVHTLVAKMGAVGAVYAYTFSYMCYFGLMIVLFRKLIMKKS